MHKPLARRAGIACLVGSLAACSSSGSHPISTKRPTPSTTTSPKTLTSYPNTPAGVRAFFANDGKTLIAFERATAELATGTQPAHATCLHLETQVLPKITRDPNSLYPLTQRIPDAVLAAAFGVEIKTKVLIALGCGRAQTLPPGQADPKAYPTVRAFAVRVRQLLAHYGIAV